MSSFTTTDHRANRARLDLLPWDTAMVDTGSRVMVQLPGGREKKIAVLRKPSTETVLSRCTAAASLAMRGENYSTEDRLDCASKLLERLWSDARTPHGLDRADCTMTRLSGMAANYRRGLDRLREVERRAAASDAFRPAIAPSVEDHSVEGDPWTVHAATPRHAEPMSQPHGSPADVLRYLDTVETIRDRCTAWPASWSPMLRETAATTVALGGAHQRAQDMLAAIGLPRLGKLYPVAYMAARTASGVPVETASAELGYSSPDTARVILNRRLKAARKVTAFPPIPAPLETAHRVGLTAERDGSLETAAPMVETTAPHGCDGCKADPMACEDHRVRVVKIPGGRKVWNGTAAADWTADLHPTTRRRLHTAAMLNRARVAKRAEGERAALHQAAADPAEVR